MGTGALDDTHAATTRTRFMVWSMVVTLLRQHVCSKWATRGTHGRASCVLTSHATSHWHMCDGYRCRRHASRSIHAPCFGNHIWPACAHACDGKEHMHMLSSLRNIQPQTSCVHACDAARTHCVCVCMRVMPTTDGGHNCRRNVMALRGITAWNCVDCYDCEASFTLTHHHRLCFGARVQSMTKPLSPLCF